MCWARQMSAAAAPSSRHKFIPILYPFPTRLSSCPFSKACATLAAAHHSSHTQGLLSSESLCRHSCCCRRCQRICAMAAATSFTALKRVAPADVQALNLDPIDGVTRKQAIGIVDAVRAGGEAALLDFAHKFKDLPEGAGALQIPRAALPAMRPLMPSEALARAQVKNTSRHLQI